MLLGLCNIHARLFIFYKKGVLLLKAGVMGFENIIYFMPCPAWCMCLLWLLHSSAV